jgi:protocatechuate 3,4-dioxygenase beta subunit
MTPPDSDKAFGRRILLGIIGGGGAILLTRCGEPSDAKGTSTDAGLDASIAPDAESPPDAGSVSDSGVAADGGADCAEIPTETAGPYPDMDDMIANATYERSDITEGKPGTPLSLTLQVVDATNGCAPIQGARVIIWHCDANGVYSEYATNMNSGNGETGSASTTFLRGWQTSDSHGNVTFNTIYPGWYTPRVTHIHVEVYNPNDLTTPVKTTQFTFPDAITAGVYAQPTLYAKGQNSTTTATDMVFSSGTEHLLAAITGSNSAGYAASLPLGVSGY